MNRPTPHDLARLERLEREFAHELRFLRHTPREDEWIPFEEDLACAKRREFRDAMLGLVALVVLFLSLVLMPGWLA